MDDPTENPDYNDLAQEMQPHSWMRYGGLVESGDPNSSQLIDNLIYGTDR